MQIYFRWIAKKVEMQTWIAVRWITAGKVKGFLS